MVSEGVDIPRLRVGVYATAAKTPLIFRQIVGRFVRTIPGRPCRSRAGCTCPPSRSSARHASEIEHELRRALRDPAPSSRRVSRSCPSGARASPRAQAEFVPLSAEFAPQMTLFGSAPAAAVTTATATTSNSTRLPAPRAAPPAGVRAPRRPARGAQPAGRRPAAPRRAQPPRDQRVAEPRGRGRPRREATIPQLERSIAALVKELTRRRSPAGR